MSAPKKPFPGSQVLLSIGLIVVSAVYVLWQNINGQQPTISPAQQFKEANDAFLQTLLYQVNQTSPATSSMMPRQMTNKPMMLPGRYIDGSYTGSAADAYYGIVQVAAFIRGGRIVDVQFLQHPDSRDTSRYINGQAMPLLTQEAITAQSEQVDGVSGATFTSQAFKQSLASALTQAKN